MKQAEWSWFVLSAVLGLAAAGCDTSEPRRAPDEPAEPEAGIEGDEEEAEFEGCPEDTPHFAPGLEARGELNHIRAQLVSASHVPPLRFLNDWTVDFVDGAGAALEDLAIMNARTFMPIHGHDGNVQPKVRALGEPGRFALDGLNFNMRGPWQVQLRLRSDSAGDDYVVFEICVEE